MMRLRRIAWLLAASSSLLMLAALPVQAADQPQSQQVLTKTYATDAFVQRGTIVTLKEKDPSKVVPAKAETLNQMLGVVISANDSALTLEGENPTDKTYVATSGRYNVMVSNQGGEIAIGDYITVSALDGVGMKTGSIQGLVLGTAATAFNGKENTLATAELKDIDGKPQKVAVGIIQADINIGQNPFLSNATGGIPETVNLLAQAIAGTPVEPIRIYISVFILFAAMCVSASLLYSGIRGSFIAIGRNPLARKSVIRGLIQVIVTALIIFTFGLLGVYLMLTL